MKFTTRKRLLITILILTMVTFFAVPFTAFAAGNSGSIKTTDVDGTTNGNVDYESKEDVYVYSDGLPAGNYWVRVVQTSGDTVLGTSASANFIVDDDNNITGGTSVDGLSIIKLWDLVQFGDSVNGVYRVEVTLDIPDADPDWNAAKSDNFKVEPSNPALTIEKKVKLADANTSYVDTLTVSDDSVTVEYQYVVTNTGNVTIEDVSVYDQTINWTSASVDIPEGESHTFTTTHLILAADWDDNEFINVASAGGIYVNDAVTSNTDDATVIYDSGFTPNPVLNIDKKVKLANSDDLYVDVLTVTDTAVTVEYQFVVTNMGNVAIDDVSVYDQTLDWTSMEVDLPIGESYSFTKTNEISAEEWDELNKFINIASAGGIYNNDPVTSGTDDATVQFEEVPSLTMVKGVRLAGTTDSFVPFLNVTSSAVSVEYQFTVENTGNVGLNVSIYDITLSWTSEEVYITPGSIYLFTTTPVAITPADWNQDDVFMNTAVAGTFFNDEPVTSQPSTATVHYNDPREEASILLQKSVNPTSVTSRGADVTYTFVITNTGDYDLFDVYIEDPAIGFLYPVGDLAVDATTTTSITFDLSLLGTSEYGDWDGNTFTNTATVWGYYGQEQQVSDEDDATVTFRRTTGGGGGGGDGTTTVIDEPTPEAPVVEEETTVLEEAIPAAPLPQTGGFPAAILFGLGSLLAGGGMLIKRKQR